MMMELVQIILRYYLLRRVMILMTYFLVLLLMEGFLGMMVLHQVSIGYLLILTGIRVRVIVVISLVVVVQITWLSML